MSYTLIESAIDVRLLMEEIQTTKLPVAFADIESTGLDWAENHILLFQIMYNKQVYIIDVRKVGYNILSSLINHLNLLGVHVVFHNAKFDLKFIYRRTKVLIQNVYDTMIAEVVLQAGHGKAYYSLEELAERYAGIFMDKAVTKEFIDLPEDKPFTEKMLMYSALDVKALEDIYNDQMQQFEDTKQVRVIELESQLIPVVTKMELDGIRLDTEAWLKVEAIAVTKRDELTAQLKEQIVDFLLMQEVPNAFELTKKACIPVTTKKLTKFLEEITDIQLLKGWLHEHFNVKSSKQMVTVLNLMGVEVENTNEKTLLEYDKDSDIINLLLSIREVNKKIDSYGRNVLEYIKPLTGKIHTEYATVGTQTGRFSSKNPNMQQVPKKGGYRECFMADEGYVFCAIDYSQQEYRLVGALSKDPVIINAYKSGLDIHTATGAIVAGVPMNEVTKEHREKGKTTNFAIIYGSTAWGLAHNLKIPTNQGEKIINDVWSGYARLSKFKEAAERMILKLGFSCTPIGRRRYNIAKPLYGDSKSFKKWEARVLREGFNHIVQGGGADVLKMAMVRIYKENPFGEYLKLCLQIHDEIVLQFHKSIAKMAVEFAVRIMEEEEQKFLGDIPAKVEAGKLQERWSK